MGPSLQEVLTFTPKPLQFGTSGVRARVEELTDLEVYCLTRGTLAYFERIGKLACVAKPKEAIAIPLAGDLRPSTLRLLAATAKAIADAGYQVDYGGFLPTPALTYYALAQGVASFVVTGSHIPADRNGQKANRCDGEVRKSDEAGILEAVEAFRRQEYARPAEASPFAPDGQFKPQFRPALPKINPAPAARYRDRYREAFAGSLEGLRVLFFEYSAVGRELLPEILTAAGAEVICVGRCEEFIPLDTEAISEAHLALLGDWVKRQGAPLDAVVSTDGDSDRPLLLGVSGEELTLFPGDLLGAVTAEYLGADAAAVPISANPALEEFLAARGIALRRTRIGSPYVIEAMQDWIQSGKQKVVAWEANGGFLVGSDLLLEGGPLQALPTRDAALPILSALAAAKRRGTDLIGLLREFPQSFGCSDLIDGFPQSLSRKIVSYFAPPEAGVEEVRFGDGAVALLGGGAFELARWPATSPQAERWLARKRLLEEVFSSRLGFAPLLAFNVLDGVRGYFANGEVAHVRPSGNAPQLRIYAYAATPARAKEIARLAVAQGGLLEQLARKVSAA
ncbi:phosphomannomutase [Methylothermus subterraneus]